MDCVKLPMLFCISSTCSDICGFPNTKTLSWNESKDCCSCDGVHCDKTTRQVIELDLSCSGLQGKFHTISSLFHLSNLKRLDLSYNDFSGSLISPKFGELSSLTHLDLMYLGFTQNCYENEKAQDKILVFNLQDLSLICRR
ncbi:receptor-like protein Cf-9 [Capsicum chacoense]